MVIKFLVDHETGSFQAEKFAKDQLVKDRDAASELHFVRRGLAAYVDDKGNLTDAEGKQIDAEATRKVVVVNTSNNRSEPDLLAASGEGKMEDGTPQRASSGPGEVITTAQIAQGEEHHGKAKKGK